MDVDGFLEHVGLPFWMFSDKKSVFFGRYFLTSFYVGLGIIFGAFCAQFWMIFFMKTGAWNKKGDFMKNLVFLK